MKNRKYLRAFAVWAACLGMLFVQPMRAAEAVYGGTLSKSVQSSPTAMVLDVSMSAEGYFSGQVMDTQAVPVVGAKVAISQAGRRVASAVTNHAGVFRIAGLQGGVYEVSASGTTKVCRLWSHGTAPPSALGNAMLIVEGPLVRGQLPPVYDNIAFGVLVGALVGAALGITLGTNSNDGDSRS